MARTWLHFLSLLACLHAGALAAQDRAELGPLPPAGETPQRMPVLERYALDGTAPSPPGNARLASTLETVDQPEQPLRLRGAREIEIYRTLAPAVALIVTDKAIGSGSLIDVKQSAAGTKSGMLLTNAHVVGDAVEVSVIFKPQKDGDKTAQSRGVPGRVRKIDTVRDLALVEVAEVPASAATIGLGSMSEVQVGADVHAIGHPSAQSWTYTKGLISQVRPGYEWQVDKATTHMADVIQTQTPINPGNSGGPLISEGGRLIGVNSFKLDGEALNFAVSVGEVERFLAAAQGGAYEPKVAAAPSKPCDAKVIYEGRTKDDTASIRNLDMDCSGRVNATLHAPDDESKPIVFRFDTNKDGKSDVWIYDVDRDGKWDYSLWDTDFDGKPDLIGHHPDGKVKPSRVEKYQPKS